VSECYFWHQLTQVVLDKGPLKELLMLLMLLRDGTVTHHCSVLYLWVVFVLKASKIDEALSQFFGEGSSFSPEGYFATDYCVMSRCEIG